MTAFIGGLVAFILGVIGIIVWWGYFIKALLAGIPVMLILGGALAAYLGIEEMKDKKAAENFEGTKEDELKKEVETLKKEIEDLRTKEEPADEEKTE